MDIKQKFVDGFAKQLVGMVGAARSKDMPIPELEEFLRAGADHAPETNALALALRAALDATSP